MISKEKALEVVEYCLTNGDEATLTAYNIPMETLNRYKREYKKHYGDTATLLMQLRQRYSEKELQAIADGSNLVSTSKQIPNISFSGEITTFGIITDTHTGSIYSEDSLIHTALSEMRKEKCQFLVHAGDSVDGMMNRPGSIYELSHIGYKAQRDAVVELFKEWEKPIYMVGGNHNDSFNSKFGVGMDITEDICSRLPDAHYLGGLEGDFLLSGAKVKVFHGNDGSSYALSYREQKIVEMMSTQELPELLITGHTHKSMYFNYRNVHIICGGTLQSQTPFMRGKKLPAHVGWWIVTTCVSDGHIKWIQPRWYSIPQ